MDTGKTDALSTWPRIKPVLQGQRVRNEAVNDKYLSKNWSGIPENIELENMLMKTEISSEKVENRIKKSLFRNLKFWEKVCTYDSVLNIIKNGYSLPFMSQPPTMHLRNNKSALNNESFVSETVQELLDSGRVVQVPFKPYVVNPLSVAENREKKRLILDLSCLNKFILTDTFKCEDWKIAMQYFQKDCFLTKFDLQSGYHHIDINPHFQTFLGFSWNGKFFCYTVLPFGLSSAPYIFTKCLRPLVKYWRKNFAKVVLYLDNGLILADSESSSLKFTKFIIDSLVSAGFYINEKKSTLNPVQDLEWLGLCWNSAEFILYIPERRISDTEITIDRVISLLPHLPVRRLASLTGKIISLFPVMGNIVRLMTRRCHVAIESRSSWDRDLNVSVIDSIIPELTFWRQNLRSYNSRHMKSYCKKNVVIYSDASNVAGAAYTLGFNGMIFHYMWSSSERIRSSTWREMKALELGLESFSSQLKGKSLKWFTDNQNCVKIVGSGSMNVKLQEIALKIFKICVANGITIEIEWVPRDQNTMADYISKIVDYEDCGVTDNFFQHMNKAKEKYRGLFEIQKSGGKTSSGEIGLDIRTHASPKVGQDQVSGGVSVLCWHAAPVAYVLWKPCTIR